MNFIKNNAFFIAGLIAALVVILIICGFVVPTKSLLFEARVMCQINSVRVEHGLEPVAYNPELMEIAKGRSRDMLSREYFSHYTPEGENITCVLCENDIYYKNFGENLAKGLIKHCTPEAVVDAWMNSASHKDNILKPYYTDIGVGIIDGDCRIITLVFIRR